MRTSKNKIIENINFINSLIAHDDVDKDLYEIIKLHNKLGKNFLLHMNQKFYLAIVTLCQDLKNNIHMISHIKYTHKTVIKHIISMIDPFKNDLKIIKYKNLDSAQHLYLEKEINNFLYNNKNAGLYNIKCNIIQNFMLKYHMILNNDCFANLKNKDKINNPKENIQKTKEEQIKNYIKDIRNIKFVIYFNNHIKFDIFESIPNDELNIITNSALKLLNQDLKCNIVINYNICYDNEEVHYAHNLNTMYGNDFNAEVIFDNILSLCVTKNDALSYFINLVINDYHKIESIKKELKNVQQINSIKDIKNLSNILRNLLDNVEKIF